MTAATLPGATRAAISRDGAMKALEALAAEAVMDSEAAPVLVAVVLPALASTRLDPAKRDEMWAAAVDEYQRWSEWLDRKRHSCDASPWDAEDRMRQALADLVDGTDFYATEGEQ